MRSRSKDDSKQNFGDTQGKLGIKPPLMRPLLDPGSGSRTVKGGRLACEQTNNGNYLENNVLQTRLFGETHFYHRKDRLYL